MAAASVLNGNQPRGYENYVEAQDEKYGLFMRIDEMLSTVAGLDFLDLAREHSVQELTNWLCLLDVSRGHSVEDLSECLCLLDVLREQGYALYEVVPGLNKLRDLASKRAEYRTQKRSELNKKTAERVRLYRAKKKEASETEYKKKNAEYMRQYRAKKKHGVRPPTETDDKS